MSFIDMKNTYDFDNIEEKKDILKDMIPSRSFYNIKKLEASIENIIEEINYDLTYENFQNIVKTYSIVAIGPMVFDHDMIPQITFISEDDCSFHRNEDYHYPPIVFQLQNKEVVPESKSEQPIYYYSGVFVFRGIQIDLLCHYISNYLLDNCDQYHDESDVFQMIEGNSFMEYTIDDRIRSRFIYNAEQSTLRENTILIKMLDALIEGDEHRISYPIKGELLDIFKMIEKYDEESENPEFLIYIIEWMNTFIRHRIWKMMITDDMEEDYGFINFAVKYLTFADSVISGQLCLFNIDNTKIMMDFEKDDVMLNIKFFIPDDDETMEFPKLVCGEIFDIICDRAIIQLRSERFEKKLCKYYDMIKFFGFMTKFFGMINDTQSMFYFGSHIAKKSGRRRCRTSKDDREEEDRYPEYNVSLQDDNVPVNQD